MSFSKKNIGLLVLAIIGGFILYLTFFSNGVPKGATEVDFETPQIASGANMGAQLPYILSESEHQLIFYCSMGVFVYDLDNEKMLRAFMPGGSQFYEETQMQNPTHVRINADKQIIEIYKENKKEYDYFYVYEIDNDKLYKYPIEELGEAKEQPIITGAMDTSDWSTWNLSYTSKLTGKIYYPFRSIAK